MLNALKYRGELGFRIYSLLYSIYRFVKYERFSDEVYLKKMFFKRQGRELNLDNPSSLNEKIQWLKLNDRKPEYSTFADKYEVRSYITMELGDTYLIPLVMETTNPEDLCPEKLPDYPFIVKANHDSGSYLIVKDKQNVDWEKLRVDCRFWLSRNYYKVDREYQYKNIKPRILVEKLLLTTSGRIPFDYKINLINGRVEFIYTSIDREGSNKRNIYDRNWNPLLFTWAPKEKDIANLRGAEIKKPACMDEMIRLAEKIGKGFPYIRIDFYDVDGKVYFGEITQHHGGGFDQIRPLEWDYKWGEMVKLDQKKINSMRISALTVDKHLEK